MIKTENLCVSFDDFKALKGINISISDGTVYGIVGSNGAGKSTLVRALTGVYKPTSGEVLYDGEPVFDNVSAKSKFVYVSDELFFLPGANMARMADFYANIYESFDQESFLKKAQALELDMKKPINGFSKGMKRQVALLLAICANTKYVYIDETFDGLDPLIRAEFKKLLFAQVANGDRTVIITSHSLRELENLCDAVAFIHKGELILESKDENYEEQFLKKMRELGYEHTGLLEVE